MKPSFLPTTRAEMEQRGWDQCDLILVTPDAYVDHPSFAMALLGRFLEKHGYRIGILSQPKWKDPESFLALGVPRLAFGVSGGNMDSLVINYTAAKKTRSDDPFCDRGEPFFSEDDGGYRIRPDRTTIVYTQKIRSACRGVPVILGGIEASLRRITHYDFWSNSVRRSILFDAKADLLVYGNGEYALLEILRNLEAGQTCAEISVSGTAKIAKERPDNEELVVLPSFQEVKTSKEAFSRAHRMFELNNDRKLLAQQQDTRYLVQMPHRLTTQEELDAVYDLPFLRRPHPRYHDIPAFHMIEHSVTTHRGCFGSCSFCSIAAHQGKEVVSRSEASVLREIRAIVKKPSFNGTITDLGGPTANMYAATCSTGGCLPHDCLKRGEGCPNLCSGIAAYRHLLQKAREIPGVKNIQINSGIRYDPPLMDQAFLTELMKHRHISGQMKVAPESGSDTVLALMEKPPVKRFEQFQALFEQVKRDAGKRFYLIPYLIVGHPGEGNREAAETKQFLISHGLTGHQFQIFTPTPMTRSTAMYYTGKDPMTGKPVQVERDLRILTDRKNDLLRRFSDVPAISPKKKKKTWKKA